MRSRLILLCGPAQKSWHVARERGSGLCTKASGSCGAPQAIVTDAFDSIHPVPAQWLRDSILAPFVPAYWCRLVERRYAPNTARTYLSQYFPIQV